MDRDPFKEYIKQSEPSKRDKGYAWHTAIGLQAVDGLKTSKYLIDTAIKNIEGDISIDEAQDLLNSYYEENSKEDDDKRTEGAKVDIESAKVDIRNKLLTYSSTLSEKTINHAIELFINCKEKDYFGRTIVEELTGLKSSRASKLIGILLSSNIIEPVSGKGKGKYKFNLSV